MKSAFPGYYRPSDEEFVQLWSECIFVPDANVLLNLYRYTPKTREELFGVLEQLKSRWISHQAALEYHRSRVTVISERLKIHQDVLAALTRAEQQLSETLKAAARHPFVNRESIIERVQELFAGIGEELEKGAEDYKALLRNDPTAERIAALFEGKVGSPYPDAVDQVGNAPRTLESIYREGKQRFERGTPPGYADAKEKAEPGCYGDLVLWFQTIDFARDCEKPIVFITDDSKEDWWVEARGQRIGPRPELVAEMRTVAGVDCWMYDSTRFIEQARRHLERSVSDETLSEVRDVRAENERTRSLIEDVVSVFDAEVFTPRVSDVLAMIEIERKWMLILEELKRMGKYTVRACLAGAEPVRLVDGELFIRFNSKTIAEMFRARGEAFAGPLKEAIERTCEFEVQVNAVGPGELAPLD
jgi:hypothetical protein